jgi:hypothetical protein
VDGAEACYQKEWRYRDDGEPAFYVGAWRVKYLKSEILMVLAKDTRYGAP